MGKNVFPKTKNTKDKTAMSFSKKETHALVENEI